MPEDEIEETAEQRKERLDGTYIELRTAAGRVPHRADRVEAAIRRGARFATPAQRDKFRECRPTSPILEDETLSKAATEE